jgi:hypothetical protein
MKKGDERCVSDNVLNEKCSGDQMDLIRVSGNALVSVLSTRGDGRVSAITWLKTKW